MPVGALAITAVGPALTAADSQDCRLAAAHSRRAGRIEDPDGYGLRIASNNGLLTKTASVALHERRSSWPGCSPS